VVVILRTLFMRDLRGNLVFPRLAYAATGQALDRLLRWLFRFLVRRPVNRVREFVVSLRDHQTAAEILLAGAAVLVALIRSLALLVASTGALYLTLFRF
jgi:hypothetical protein